MHFAFLYVSATKLLMRVVKSLQKISSAYYNKLQWILLFFLKRKYTMYGQVVVTNYICLFLSAHDESYEAHSRVDGVSKSNAAPF